MKRQHQILLAIVAVAVVVMGFAYMRQQQKAQNIIDEGTIRTAAMQFGSQMQKVSLTAPNADNQIANTYAPYVTSSLIAKWQQNKTVAPGKKVSSPWPSELVVSYITKQKDGSYVVQGMVSEVTSQEVAHGGVAAQFPVTLKYQKYKDQWLIVSYDPGIETVFTLQGSVTQ